MGREQLYENSRRAAEAIRGSHDILVATHIDADGICAGSIASSALELLGKEHKVRFFKKLDQDAMNEIMDIGASLVWFTDLGSGNLDLLGDLNAVITDHHIPSRSRALTKKDRGNILSYCQEERDLPHVNPHLAGLDGARDLSGSGSTYLVARELDKGNSDLAALAVVGSVGDLQDTEALALTGTNREVMEDGRRAGVLDWHMDIRFFGRETRPVFKMLQYSNDPVVPGLTGNEEACMEVLSGLGIPLKAGENWRAWVDLDKAERRTLVSYLVENLLKKGMGHRMTLRMLGEVYILTREREGTELHDAKEFATLLNSCGRHGKAEVGYRVCMGDRGEWLEKAELLLSGHRRSLVEALRYVESSGISQAECLQYFHAGDSVPDTIVGTIAGMLLNSADADGGKPMFGFAVDPEQDAIKVSARGTRQLIEAGLDLSEVMSKVSKELGGRGGGHNIAAGATIPRGSEEEFISRADAMIKRQMGK